MRAIAGRYGSFVLSVDLELSLMADCKPLRQRYPPSELRWVVAALSPLLGLLSILKDVRRSLSTVTRIGRLVAALATMVIVTVFPVHLVVHAGSAQPTHPVTEADGRLGLCNILPGTAGVGVSWARLATDAGARINRWEFRWDRIQHHPNSWDFVADDSAVDSSQAAGLRVEGILIGTPGWATAAGQRPGNGVPQGLSTNPTAPTNLWASYVRATATRYRGAVGAWEIWNEPDLHFFWMGTPRDYALLLRTAYLVIKEIDPTATVLIAGMVVPDLGFVDKVLAEIRADSLSNANGGYFDAAAWHAYGQAALLFTNLTRYRALLSSRGFTGVPLWVTEDGFPASNPNGEPRQAAYVTETIAYALAAGASKVFVYRASDDALPKTWGLLTQNGQPRMAYTAFQIAARYFSGASGITYLPGSQIQRFALYRTNQHITLLWNRGVSDRMVRLPAATSSADLVDASGVIKRIMAADGEFQLLVPGAKYNVGVDKFGSVVGGDALLLIEDNTPVLTSSSRSFVPSFSGPHRELAILNHNVLPAVARVASTSNQAQQQIVHLPGLSLRTLDLDLLAGPSYRLPYSITSSEEVALLGASGSTAVFGAPASATWFVPVASRYLTVTNPDPRTALIEATGYSVSGRIVATATLQVGGNHTEGWTLPVLPSHTALVVHAAVPVSLTPAEGTTATPHVDPTWYVVHPGDAHLSLFNPDRLATIVDVRFVGAATVTGQQLRLRARHSFSLRTSGAEAVIIRSASPIAAGYAGIHNRSYSLTSDTSTTISLVSAGTNTRVSIFNPSVMPAHVTYALVGASGSSEHALVVAPTHISTIVARSSSAAARGVIVRSDVPVVAGSAP